ncbi:carboxypeptidase regulatory-like domain-containing protein, partial [Pyxidicoccus sp. 3LFB2]
MKRPLLIATCVLLGLTSGCGSDGAAPDPGVRTEDAEAVDLDNLKIRVSGRAEVLPEARRLLESRGQPVPSLEGVPVSIEEPLRLSVNDANASFGASTLTADGAFSVDEVAVREMHQSLAAGLAAPGLVRTASVHLRHGLHRRPAAPRTWWTRGAWALPDAFHDRALRRRGRA